MKLFRLLVLGALLWAGTGEAWASSCDWPVQYDDCRSEGTTFVLQYGPGVRRSHGRGHYGYGGWRGRGWYSWHRPVRRYTEAASPACSTLPYAAPAYGETLVVNVRNANGSYTPVTLRRQGNVYVGPRGEQYLLVPTEEQLKDVYGLQ